MNEVQQPYGRPDGIEFERHFSPQEIAEMWGLSSDAVRDIFRDEPGVMKLGHSETRHKRSYETLRIPESIVKAVHRKRRNRLN